MDRKALTSVMQPQFWDSCPAGVDAGVLTTLWNTETVGQVGAASLTLNILNLGCFTRAALKGFSRAEEGFQDRTSVPNGCEGQVR